MFFHTEYKRTIANQLREQETVEHKLQVPGDQKLSELLADDDGDDVGVGTSGAIPRATLHKEEQSNDRPQSFIEELTETIKDRKVSSSSSDSEKSRAGYY